MELSVCATIKNVFKTCYKYMIKKVECCYDDDGMLYHCICYKCTEIYHETSKKYLGEDNKPLIQTETDV